ncbi:hypothetical protein [Rahnella woolbedingensis]|uniref:Lipoprotein n=1 Tax=Rahnella woolbedingensis TaxID=1510574 RepID=A0A419N7G9_9GAMM|nr:hypothetical protein [Rahnella woolbedingensis]RJT43350.1 hypothetical protein D6C13_13765 [Rahnella woolbedingensis]
MKKIMMLLALILAGCSSPEAQTVHAINTLSYPTRTAQQPASVTANISPDDLENQYSSNELLILRLRSKIKAASTDKIRTEEVFDTHTDVAQAFNALSRLEQFQALNTVYYSEKDMKGMDEIHQKLSPLI